MGGNVQLHSVHLKTFRLIKPSYVHIYLSREMKRFVQNAVTPDISVCSFHLHLSSGLGGVLLTDQPIICHTHTHMPLHDCPPPVRAAERKLCVRYQGKARSGGGARANFIKVLVSEKEVAGEPQEVFGSAAKVQLVWWSRTFYPHPPSI